MTWHVQANPCQTALSTAADCLFLQLDRYGSGPGDEAVQHSQPLAIPHTLTLPVFGRDLRGFKAVYQVAIITREDECTGMHHFRTILRSKADCARGTCWQTVADRKARHVSAKCHVLALIRSSLLQ